MTLNSIRSLSGTHFCGSIRFLIGNILHPNCVGNSTWRQLDLNCFLRQLKRPNPCTHEFPSSTPLQAHQTYRASPRNVKEGNRRFRIAETINSIFYVSASLGERTNWRGNLHDYWGLALVPGRCTPGLGPLPLAKMFGALAYQPRSFHPWPEQRSQAL